MLKGVTAQRELHFLESAEPRANLDLANCFLKLASTTVLPRWVTAKFRIFNTARAFIPMNI
jgi:hypothetical protein